MIIVNSRDHVLKKYVVFAQGLPGPSGPPGESGKPGDQVRIALDTLDQGTSCVLFWCHKWPESSLLWGHFSHACSVGSSWRGRSCWYHWTKSKLLFITNKTPKLQNMEIPSNVLFILLKTYFDTLAVPLLGWTWFPWWERRCWPSGSSGTQGSSRNSRNWWTQGNTPNLTKTLHHCLFSAFEIMLTHEF